MRKAFYEQVDDITKNVISMADLAQSSVRKAVNSLIKADSVLAQKVIDGDRKIDNYEISIEEKCIILQAEYQPLAKDLRYIHSVSNIIIHLERIGDLSVNIAKISKSLSKMNSHYLNSDMEQLLAEMLNLANSVLRKAMAAFKESNFKLASNIGIIDDAVDNIQKAIIQKLYSLPFNKKENIKIIAYISLVARYLERVGDHSVSIGERVLYYLTGNYRVFHEDI
jgi:phosphate transport system protein